jgi:hypothetical protein
MIMSKEPLSSSYNQVSASRRVVEVEWELLQVWSLWVEAWLTTPTIEEVQEHSPKWM